MEKDAEKFLEAEETAIKLVDSLKKLQGEALSYQTASQELATVRLRLLELIESTERVTVESHAIIKILQEVGGPEILNRLSELEKRLIDSTEELIRYNQETINRIESDVEPELLERLAEVEINLNTSTQKIIESNQEINKLINDFVEPEISNRLSKLEDNLSEKLINQQEEIREQKLLLIITLISSIIGIVLGLITLF